MVIDQEHAYPVMCEVVHRSHSRTVGYSTFKFQGSGQRDVRPAFNCGFNLHCPAKVAQAFPDAEEPEAAVFPALIKNCFRTKTNSIIADFD
jgi:hypothetical protein